MSFEERGCYITLLCLQWTTGGIAKDDFDRIAQPLASHSLARVKAKFQKGEDELLRNDRLERERRKQDAFRASRSESGKAGAVKRWHGHSSAIAHPMANDSSPSPSPNACTQAERPSLAEVQAAAQFIGLAIWKAEHFFNEMEGCGWLDFNHRPIKDWKAVLLNVKVKWEADGRPDGPPAAKSFKPKGPPAAQRYGVRATASFRP